MPKMVRGFQARETSEELRQEQANGNYEVETMIKKGTCCLYGLCGEPAVLRFNDRSIYPFHEDGYHYRCEEHKDHLGALDTGKPLIIEDLINGSWVRRSD